VQLPALVDAYLTWKHRSGPIANTASESGDAHYFEVRQIGLQGKSSLLFSPALGADLQLEYSEHYRVWQPLVDGNASPHWEEANVCLIKCGLLGCSPRLPTTAITLETLEIYHQIRRRQSSFSVQAISKVICALHGVCCFCISSNLARSYISQLNYLQTYRDQLASAFDVYLDILRHVRHRVDQALKCDSLDWHLKHACPPCNYKVSRTVRFIEYLPYRALSICS
jgi:hypothetical protein